MIDARTVRGKPVKYRRNCLVCAAEYTYLPAGKDKGKEHQRGLFCGRVCRSKHIADSKPAPFTKVYSAQCVGCQAPMVSRRPRDYCGTGCRPKPVEISPPMARTCKRCGQGYEAANTGGKHRQYCGVECKRAADAVLKRIDKSKRKAVLKGATIERVDPFDVFDRDGWKCMLCGIDTPKAKRGTQDDDAPELDHVIPISKGGEHSHANTQCSCRKCNLFKSNKIVSKETFQLNNVTRGHYETSQLVAL